MLESDYDEHVKAHQLVQKWDGAHRTFADLYALKQKSMGLMKEMGRSIAYHRALARAGLKREDVARPISGGAIGATHNYKVKMPAKMCRDTYCSGKLKPQSEEAEVCGACGGQLDTVQVPIPPNHLRGKLANHIVGVELNSGRFVWFDEPIPPQPAAAPFKPLPSSKTPFDAKEFSKGGKLEDSW